MFKTPTLRRSAFVAASCLLLLSLGACSRFGGGNGEQSSSSSSVRSVVAQQVQSAGTVSSGMQASSRRSAASSGGIFSDFLNRKSSSSANMSSAALSSSVLQMGTASSSSAGAPFFSLRSSSSASGSVVAPSLGNLKLHVEADRGEARPGDQVFYVVTVKNISTTKQGPFKIIFAFFPAQLSILEADGEVRSESVEWTVDSLEPQQKRALRVRAQLNANLAHGDIVGANAIATVNGVIDPATAAHQLNIIQQLPPTGLGDGTLPFENTRRFLSPFHGAGASSAIPATVWAATILMGLALGGTAAKKFL